MIMNNKTNQEEVESLKLTVKSNNNHKERA